MTSVLAPIYSARDTAITQRPTSTALLAIDSEDRFANNQAARDEDTRLASSPYDFTINKNQSLMNGFFTRLGVTEAMFNWMIPNINYQTSEVGFNYKASLFSPTVAAQITLDIGFYTPSQIASAIQTAVRALDPIVLGAFTMTYGINGDGQQAPVFLARSNTAARFAFYPLTSDQLGTVPQVGIQSRQLFDLLGFTIGPVIPGSFDTEKEGYTTFCQITRYVDIVCTQLTNNQALKDTMSQPVARDVLCRLYLSDSTNSQATVLPSSPTFCPAGCMPTTLYRDFSQAKQIQWIPNQPVPGYLRFEVFDEDGNNLRLVAGDSWLDGTNWALTILVTEN